MPTFSNVHAELDNHELHPPRDFSLAETGTFLAKNPLGDIQWFEQYWQRPILGFANAALPPLTLAHGDRYILSGSGSASPSIDTSVDYSIDTSIWLDTSMDGTAVDSSAFNPAPDSSIHPAWGDVALGDIVEFYQTNYTGQPVYDWRATTPKGGYQVYNLADQETYCYTGHQWQKRAASGSAPAAPQSSGTYAQLSLLAAQGQLVAGLRYLITDRDIIVTAVSGKAFSLQADCTMGLPAIGSMELLSGTGGSIDSLLVNGQNLLPSPVVFDESLDDTASFVADAISDATGTHGFYAISMGSKVFISYTGIFGALPNGTAIVVGATDIGTQTVAFNHGRPIGERWFSIAYRFGEDWIASMADGQGNVVSCEPDVVAELEINPYSVFPWGFANVVNNTVTNAVLVAYPETGTVAGNRVDNRCLVMLDMAGDSVFIQNHVNTESLMQLHLHNCEFTGNSLSTSSAFLGFSGGLVAGNTFSGSLLFGNDIQNGTFTDNAIADSLLLIDGATLNQMSQCTMVESELHCNQSQLTMAGNQLKQLELLANGAEIEMGHNECQDCKIDLTGVTGGYAFNENHISGGSQLNLAHAQGSFERNRIAYVIMDGENLNTSFNGNSFLHYNTLDLTNFTGTEFAQNTVEASHINLAGSSTTVTDNRVLYSYLTMLGSGGTCIQNDFRNAEVTANNATSQINTNHIDLSTVKLSNTSCNFSGNKATYYSEYDLDGYLGGDIVYCEVLKSSKLIANSNTLDQGRIVLAELTTLDISNQNCFLYLSNFNLPQVTIKLAESQANAICNAHFSTLNYSVEIELDGSLNLDIDTIRYGGLYNIINSGAITHLIGLSSLPQIFTLAPQSPASISIDTTALNLKMANGITLGTLDGSAGHYVKLSQVGGGLTVTEAFTN